MSVDVRLVGEREREGVGTHLAWCLRRVELSRRAEFFLAIRGWLACIAACCLWSVRVAEVNGPCANRRFVAVACTLHNCTNRPSAVIWLLYPFSCGSDVALVRLRSCPTPGLAVVLLLSFRVYAISPRISGATSPERGCGACIRRPLASALRPLAAGPGLRRRLDRFTPCARAGLLLAHHAVHIV